MPQVDIEAPVSVCAGDSKIGEEDQSDLPPDFPPESFWLSKDAEFDWFDRNAFLERRDSTKGNSNSNSSKNLNPTAVSISSASQRYTKSKPSIIGLPKTHKTNFNNQRKCKTPSIQLFPKRTGSMGKSGAEPTSPKVSCMGRVRSKRGRRRSSEPAPKSVEKRKSGGRRSTGIYGRFIAIFQSGTKSKSARGNKDPPPSESPPRRSVSVKPRKSASFPEPPALGGMTRFASGRRSAASYEDLEH